MDDKIYEAESILDMKVTGARRYYLIKWKNYPMDECTWEPPENLLSCDSLIAEYESSEENKKVSRMTKKRGRKRKRARAVLSKVAQEATSDADSSSCGGFSSKTMKAVSDSPCIDFSNVVKLVGMEKNQDQRRFRAEFVDGTSKWIDYNSVHQHLKDQLIAYYEQLLDSET